MCRLSNPQGENGMSAKLQSIQYCILLINRTRKQKWLHLSIALIDASLNDDNDTPDDKPDNPMV